jgi:hypothetical protein
LAIEHCRNQLENQAKRPIWFVINLM